MKAVNEFASDLIDALEMLVDVSSYSGRGMYGKQCVSFTYDNEREMLSVIVKMAAENPDLARRAASGARFDSMGRGSVIYWPSAEVTEEETEPQ